MRAEFKYRDSSGNIQTGYMTLEDYRLASDHNMTAASLVNSRHSDADPQFGSAFEQGCKYLGIFPKSDRKYGILPTTIKHILDGSCAQQLSGFQLASGATVVSPKGPTSNSTPASRLFFPEVVLGFISEELEANYGAEEAAFNQMFAMNTAITSEVWTQPVINTTAPQAYDMRPIGQNSLPTSMCSITASQSSKALGAISIGLQISEQAMRDATIPLVSIIVREQAMGQRMRQLWRDLNAVVTDNVDAGESALTPVAFTDYDSTAGANEITHAGYLKLLWNPDRIYSYDIAFGPLDSYLAIEKRTGRPLAYDPNTGTVNLGNEGSYGLNPGNPTLMNFGTSSVRYLVVPDGVVPAGQFVLMDSRYSLARVTNVSANYAATEQQILSRSSFWRWDMAEFVYRLRESAMLLVDFSNP